MEHVYKKKKKETRAARYIKKIKQESETRWQVAAHCQ